MENKSKGLLAKNYLIDNKYSVILFIKEGNCSETYRVKGSDGQLYLLKLIKLYKLPRSAFDSDNNPLEIEFLKEINHPNIVSYKDSGEFIFEDKKFSYLVLDFIVGETLAERILRENISTLYDVKEIAIEILNGLSYLHSLGEPIIHNQMTPQNITLDLSADIPVAKIIGFGYARSFHQSSKSFNKEGMNLNFVASECFNNQFSPQSDIFSVGAIMYYLLFGMPPWFKDISNYQADRVKVEDLILDGRKKPLAFPNISDDIVDFNQSILTILKKALNLNSDNRFQSANEFIQALNGEIEIPKEAEKQAGEEKPKVEKKRFSPNSKFKGFNAIAGMQELKDKLYNDVIDLLNDKEGAERYSLSIPNGMLLYGPPGCGKTFFAEKFAEETGYNYKYIRSSDLASIYIHGSQGKIGDLFKEARETAPIILCFDELDALVPDRNSVNNASQSGEVNEFLSQLNNCGEDGIFIIGTTNKPDLIDSAVLRAGRIDIQIYVSLPDQESRKALFELYLKDKPLDFGIDYDRLATLTENYIVSDLVKIVRESGSTLRKSRGRITMEVLEKIIQKTEPSVTLDEIKKHEAIRDKFQNNKNAKTNERRKVGY